MEKNLTVTKSKHKGTCAEEHGGKFHFRAEGWLSQSVGEEFLALIVGFNIRHRAECHIEFAFKSGVDIKDWAALMKEMDREFSIMNFHRDR